jgi:hypothetical protein
MFNFIKGKDMATLFLLLMMMVALGEMLHGYLKVLNQSGKCSLSSSEPASNELSRKVIRFSKEDLGD